MHRTQYNQLGKYGAKMPPRAVPDVEKAEKLSRLGCFAGIFSSDDEEERAQRVKQFRASLETQARRLDTYKPEYRRAGSRMATSQLQAILDDAQALDEKQKSEVKPIVDFCEKRLQELRTSSPGEAK
jgi:hypothetical protein